MSASCEAWAVVPAGGSGSRFSPSADKLMANLLGLPVLLRTLQALLAAPLVHGLVLAASEANEPIYRDLIAEHLSSHEIYVVRGGASRRESVFLALQVVPECVDIVAVHDAARPLIQPQVIEKAIQRVAKGTSGSVVGVPVHDTVKRTAKSDVSDGFSIETTVDRSRLWCAQTPQVFPRELLEQAHRTVPQECAVTDDAQLMELAGFGPVWMCEGSVSNLKITTPQDLQLATALLQAEMHHTSP